MNRLVPDDAVILLDPHPRSVDLIFSEQDKKRLESIARVLWFDGQAAPEQYIDQHLAKAVALIGQTKMDRHRLDLAGQLRAIFNVEGNFLPNIDYEECYRRKIPVLACAPAFAPAVAELALGLALAAARRIVESDASFRVGEEKYSRLSNTDSVLLRGRTFGFYGCGNVGQQLLPLIRVFGGPVLIHDPWLHKHYVEGLGATPVSFEELLGRSQVLFVIAASTTENRAALGADQFAQMAPGTIVVLVGRSEVVDFDALLDAAESSHLRVAIDVFPEEPLPAGHRARKTPNTILSGHRAGGLPETYREIGRMVVDDLELILNGLAPQRMQRALIERVAKMRGKPVTK